MQFTFTYNQSTAVVNGFNSSALAFAADLRRAPVAFHGRVKDPLLMRHMLLALHDTILGDFTRPVEARLDPVITVHPDQIFFEAFSADQSAYARLSMAPEAFEIDGAAQFGTTNIDFTRGLRTAIEQLRSSRATIFSIGAGGFGVTTAAGSQASTHFEHKVDLPDAWVKGFLQVQSALAAHPYTFDVRPVDLLSVISHFMDNSNRRPPRGMRYEFRPGQAINIVLEPWEHRYWLADTRYTGYERVVRTWGRRRLELLLGVLPYAERVTIGVLGRGLPHFYICRCGDYVFTLVLSGWVANDWSATSAMDLLAPSVDLEAETVAAVYNSLTQYLALTAPEVAAHTVLDGPRSEAALFALCRSGRAMFDPTTNTYRSRELFAEPLDFATVLTPDPRVIAARELAASGEVTIASIGPSEKRKSEIKIQGQVEGNDVTVALDRENRVRFASCTCAFFREHLLSQGPCAHILAVRLAAEARLPDVEKSITMETPSAS